VSALTIAAIAAVVSAALVGQSGAPTTATGSGNALGSHSAGIVALPKEALDFGEVWVQKDFRWTLPIHNPTDQPVDVVKVETSCLCATVEPASFTIPPRRTQNLELRLDLTARDGRNASQGQRRVVVEVTPLVRRDRRTASDNAESDQTANGGALAAAARWRIVGRVKTPVLFDPPVADFGEVVVAGPAPQPKRVRFSR
jgi:hypothetical protein